MHISLDSFLRFFGIILYLTLFTYWRLSADKAAKEKPEKSRPRGLFNRTRLVRVSIACLFGFMLLQLIGVSFLPGALGGMTGKILGVVVMFIGLTVCVFARRALGSNWAHAADYQIKKQHELVTHGIYHWVRHPIYTGFCCVFVGGELIVQSYLVFLLFVLFLFGYDQARREEKILTTHFGTAYLKYMQSSKMFLPYLW